MLRGRQAPSVSRWLASASVLRRAAAAIQGVCFWVAVAIPFLYLPLLALDGIVPAMPTVLFGLIGVNLLSLVVGHGYDPSRRRARLERT